MKKIPFAESKKSGLITLCPQKVENTIHNLPGERQLQLSLISNLWFQPCFSVRYSCFNLLGRKEQE